MWVGAIKLEVWTNPDPDSGTKSIVQVMVLRDTEVLIEFPIDHPPEVELKRGSIKTFELIGSDWIARRNDETPVLPPGFFELPMPYPNYGFEFSHGLEEHLHLRLRIEGPDLWQWANIHMWIKQIRLVNSPFGFKIWKRDSRWTDTFEWVAPDVSINMSTDPNEGVSTFDLHLWEL